MAEPMVDSASAGQTDDGPLVVDLADLSADRIAEVGGKAANLGELIAAGFDVPPGFCVTTVAYRLATRGTMVEDGSATDAGAARSAVLTAPFPSQVADAVRSAYLELGSGSDIAVAVRSSATAEDLPGASFAGQQDTYLNITGVENVLDAVHRCWASLWTDRAVAYRAAQEIDGAGVALAVVVQQMVDATVAGVLFTADPVTGRRRQAVIDAAPGLGESVVSGSVDPDRFVVDTATHTVLDRRHGGEPNFCLTDHQVIELARSRRPGGGFVRRAPGHRVGLRCQRARLAHPIPPDHHAVPDPGSAKGTAGQRDQSILLRQPGPGLAPPDHPDRHRDIPGDRFGRLATRRSPTGSHH